MSRRGSRDSGFRRYWRRWYSFWFPSGWVSWLWLFFALMPLYFFQDLVHEGSHGLAATFCSGRFTRIAPFPHYSNVIDGCRSGVAFTHAHLPDPPQIVTLAPQCADVALVWGLTLILAFCRVRHRSLRFLLRIAYLGVCVDLLFNTSGGLVGMSGPRSDWGRLQASCPTNSGIFALTWIIWLVILASYFLLSYFSVWHRDPPERASFWDYRWVSLILMLLSVIAIAFSLAVGLTEPTMDTASGCFVAALVGQFIYFTWNFVYFLVTFFYP